MPLNQRTRKADRDPPYGKWNRRRRVRIGRGICLGGSRTRAKAGALPIRDGTLLPPVACACCVRRTTGDAQAMLAGMVAGTPQRGAPGGPPHMCNRRSVP